MSRSRFLYLLSLILWTVVLMTALFVGKTGEQPQEPRAQAGEGSVVEAIPGDDIEAVPMERDPVREDIPLDAETQQLLWQACEETGLTYELALAVIWKETTFRNVVGDGGESFGYMQVQPKWHQERMDRYGVTDLMDPYSNFLVGCDYLVELADKDRGIQWMLHAYNGGPAYANKMAKAGKVSQYASDVLSYMNTLSLEEF